MSSEMLEGKVGRMYVPRQELGSIATRKMKVRAFSPNDGCYATAAACAVHICICMCCELGCIASKKKGVMVSFYSMRSVSLLLLPACCVHEARYACHALQLARHFKH